MITAGRYETVYYGAREPIILSIRNGERTWQAQAEKSRFTMRAETPLAAAHLLSDYLDHLHRVDPRYRDGRLTVEMTAGTITITAAAVDLEQWHAQAMQDPMIWHAVAQAGNGVAQAQIWEEHYEGRRGRRAAAVEMHQQAVAMATLAQREAALAARPWWRKLWDWIWDRWWIVTGVLMLIDFYLGGRALLENKLAGFVTLGFGAALGLQTAMLLVFRRRRQRR